MDKLTHADCFGAVTAYLSQWQSFWRDSVFYDLCVPWRKEFPALSVALLALSDADFRVLDQSPRRLSEFLAAYIPEYDELVNLVNALAPYDRAADVTGRDTTCQDTRAQKLASQARLAAGVPGRKWQQIQAYMTALGEPIREHLRVVDWCSGKSHLGRAVAWSVGASLHFIERNPELCAAGLKSAQTCLGDLCVATFDCADVLTDPVHFQADDAVVALHACGDLHRTLLQRWLQSPSGYLALAPCCYHQWLKDIYVPQSTLARSHDLCFTRNQIRVAVQEMVTSPERVRRQADELKVYRLAFDLLQRDVRGVNAYLPTPSLPGSAVNLGVDAVVRLLAEKKGLSLPDKLDMEAYLQRARERYRQVQRLNLATQGFRRAIECWLVLDLVLALEEQGARVQLQQFCDRQLTPRNLLITATR